MEGTNVTENAVLSILLCQPNLEHIESEFLTPALLKLVGDSNLAEDLFLEEAENEISEPSLDVERNLTR